MTTFAERLAGPSGTLWIDYNEYAGALLAEGGVPWLDVAKLISWQRQANRLLSSDVISLPLVQVVKQWLKKHPKLVEMMGSKRRIGFALRTLLANLDLRTHLIDLSDGLRTSFPNLLLALVTPSPAVWVGQAHAQAFAGELIEIDIDSIDSAAVYVADFMRIFAEAGIDVLLLEENAATEPTDQETIDAYKPLFNLAAHYRWELGLRVPSGSSIGTLGGPDFWIAPRTVSGIRVGAAVGIGFWEGETAPVYPEGGFWFLEIPAKENPEHVLDRLATLR